MEMFEYIDIMNQPYDIFVTDNVNCSLHWHHYSEIIYILEGSVGIVCNNRDTVIRKGDICYFYPLQLHRIQADPNCAEPVKYAVIKFNIYSLGIPQTYVRKMYDCFVNRTPERDFCIVLSKNMVPDMVPFIVQNIFDEYENKNDMYMLAVQAEIFRLLIFISRNTEKEEIFRDNKSDTDLFFYHILEYIDSHSSEPIEVSKLAGMCHMSYSHFARRFKENYGRTCKEYIKYIRLNKAQDMLLYSDYDLEYIAQKSGFSDCSYFIRTYKKWRGITPKQERLRNK